jgi:hypothetical protein
VNKQTFTNWGGGYDPYGGESQPLLGPTPLFRDEKDRRLAAFGASPDTMHPDGYLGTITNRRQDKLLNTLHRKNHRSYSRGVHKGERINPGDYVWPEEFTMWTGIQLQSEGKKYAPPGAEPVRLTNDGKAGPRGVPRGLDRPQQEIIDQNRRSMLRTLLPTWR